MTIFSRFSDIVQANVNSLLDKAEDPKKMVRLLVQEMDAALVTLRSEAAKHLAEQKRIERERKGLETAATNWQEKAEKAVSHDREDLARKALQQRQVSLQAIASLDKDLELAKEQIDKLSADISTLQDKVSHARQRQQQLEVRSSSASVRLQSKQLTTQQAVADSMAKYERYEARVEELEARVEAYDLGKNTGLAAEFEQLEHEDAVEQELQALYQRAKASSNNKPAAS
ncbi:MAG: PspA/IM30 family protein [Idiomarina sp.]